MPITELDKPSIFGSSSLFSKGNIVIADDDRSMAMLVKKVLLTLGCQRIFIVSDGEDVLRLMKEEQIDLIVNEWELKSMNGVELTRHLRLSLDSPNRMIPILMLTA